MTLEEEFHEAHRALLNVLHGDKEEVEQIVEELAAAYRFQGSAQRYLESICPHESWRYCTYYYHYECKKCGKCRDSRPEGYEGYP